MLAVHPRMLATDQALGKINASGETLFLKLLKTSWRVFYFEVEKKPVPISDRKVQRLFTDVDANEKQIIHNLGR